MAPIRLSKSVFGTLRVKPNHTLPIRQRCLYHSYEHDQPPPFPEAESSILSAAMRHVPDHGFTNAALKFGARDAGYLDVSTNLLPRGVFDLINYHLVTQRLALKDSVQFPTEGQVEGKAMGVGAKVRALTLARLRANGPIIHRWQEALAIMAQPTYAPASVAELARLADEIWFLAADTSVDSSWYTKRASLSALYAASDVFMTQDTSKDFIETEQFFDARLKDVSRMGSFMGAVGEWVGYTGHSAVNVLRSKGVRI
ncbi:ubiquinone biosynthesis protein COQ9 [Aaosphaeria arxii CBS 175.79]|uniref:Ubiquinone biosynthesis protein n=1 Tax=Aaosphaeria arxii CBS 175.79 TaxID=1450172 RepID=A0A6A5XHT3_9PLEO|nr:ubiquinone biosynthesis protein COQ9 [Aaosphaeria arxii CBS 175.79]KAF2012381.1 ubiquinone biosynthesis protein COQ9 [Aaosphaeria arxii CBS 175.79]